MLYEVRTYTLRPGTTAEFEERFAKRLPLREKHSKLGAFWHTEFGPLNQVIHVYAYDDLGHRTRVRTAMAQDTAMQQLPGGGDLIVAQEAENGVTEIVELGVTAVVGDVFVHQAP